MAKNNTNSLDQIEQNFKELIVERCKFCGFDKYLVENPDFEFPKIDESLLGWENAQHITVPGMFGGFTYYIEEADSKFVLCAEQSSRMDRDSDDYLYFEVTENGSRMLESKEREVVRKKFCELAKEAHKKHLQELKAMRESERII